MKTIEKIKWLNKGIRLGEMCRNLTDGKRGQGIEKRIYAGTEDYVEFFETIISTLGLQVDYEVEDCDGEKEIVIREVR